MTEVFVLEVGCYATPEAAQAAHAPKRPNGSRGVRGREYGQRAGEPWLYEWSYEWSGPDDDGDYHFSADWDDAAGITRYEVKA